MTINMRRNTLRYCALRRLDVVTRRNAVLRPTSLTKVEESQRCSNGSAILP